LTPAQQAAFPHKNVIVRAVGMPAAKPDQNREARAPDLIATDSVYSALRDALLAKILQEHRADSNACVRELLDDADATASAAVRSCSPITSSTPRDEEPPPCAGRWQVWERGRRREMECRKFVSPSRRARGES
jgi:hypothetical protein